MTSATIAGLVSGACRRWQQLKSCDTGFPVFFFCFPPVAGDQQHYPKNRNMTEPPQIRKACKSTINLLNLAGPSVEAVAAVEVSATSDPADFGKSQANGKLAACVSSHVSASHTKAPTMV